jgi:hypothetical protein
MKFALLEAAVIASTILVSAAYAQQTGTIEPSEAPPPLDLPASAAVTQAHDMRDGLDQNRSPAWAITNKIKIGKLRQAGLTEADKSRFELGHLIPLALSGAACAMQNAAELLPSRKCWF